jgi:hypothetical protein
MATDIFLKPINRAAQVYTSGPSFQRTHRLQFQFVLVYNLYTDVVDNFLSDRVKYLIAYRDRLHFLCNQVESPKLETDQDVFNQYNRKRVINRKVTFSPVNVRMYDTHDGMALKFAKTLYEFEFQNARLYKESNEDVNYEQSVLIDDNQFRQTHEYGMRSHDPQRHRLIKSIDLYQIAGGKYSKTRMVHPRLQRFDMDTFDFSSSQLVNVSLSFNYENLLFEEVNVPLAQAEYDLPRLFEESAQGLHDTAPPVVNELPEPPETKLEPDVPTPPNTVTQDSNTSVAPGSNNSPIKKEVTNTGNSKARATGVNVYDAEAFAAIQETPEYQELYNEGLRKYQGDETKATKWARQKYKNQIESGEIDPATIPDEAKGSNFKVTGGNTVVGLKMEEARDTPEYQEIYNDLNTLPNGQPRPENENPQTQKRIEKGLKAAADKKYRNKVINGEIDPPAEAKSSNYEIKGSPEEKTVAKSTSENNSTSKSSVSNTSNTSVNKKVTLSESESASLYTANPDQSAINKLEEVYEPMSDEALLDARQVHVDEQKALTERYNSLGPGRQENEADLWNARYNSHENQIRVIDSELQDRKHPFSRENNSILNNKGTDGYQTSISSNYGDLNQDSFVGVKMSGGRTPVGQIKDSSGNIQEVPMSEYNSLKNQFVDQNDVR